jgi:hypothetical protein
MFKFTIRELLLLTLVVGLAVGWWLHYRKNQSLASENRMLRNELQSALDAFELNTGEGIGTQLPNGEYFHYRDHHGIIMKGGS